MSDLIRPLEEWTTEEWRALEADLAELEGQLPSLAVAARTLAEVCERILEMPPRQKPQVMRSTTERVPADRFVWLSTSPGRWDRFVCWRCTTVIHGAVWIEARRDCGSYVCGSCKASVTGEAG